MINCREVKKIEENNTSSLFATTQITVFSNIRFANWVFKIRDTFGAYRRQFEQSDIFKF